MTSVVVYSNVDALDRCVGTSDVQFRAILSTMSTIAAIDVAQQKGLGRFVLGGPGKMEGKSCLKFMRSIYFLEKSECWVCL